MKKSVELRQERAKLINDAHQVLDKADKEKRNLTAEEQQQWDKLFAAADDFKSQIDRLEKQEELDREMALRGGPPDTLEKTTQQKDQDKPDFDEALRTWLLMGSDARPSDEKIQAARRAGIEPFNRTLSFRLSPKAPKSVREVQEYRAQSVGTTTAGGFTVPDEMMKSIEISLLAFGGMREVSRIIRTGTGADLPWPTVNDTSNVGEILAENTAANEQDVTFGQIVMKAYKYSSKMVRVSVELLQDSSVNVPSLLGQLLGERLARITNTHYTTGDNSSKPQGVVTGSSVGVTGATGQTTTIIFNDLVDLVHSLDPAYRPNAKFMMHDSSLKVIRKIKDNDLFPIFLPGTLAERGPDTILGYPIVINQDVAVMAASAKSVLFGNFDKYLIREVTDLTLLRLDERYAELHQVAWLAFLRADGRVLDAGTDPFKHYANSAT